MPTSARVVVCPGEPGPLQIHEVDLPDPGPHQVVVKQFASGVCHSQLHQMHRPRTGANQLLGHESTGVVVARGSAVSNVKEGDHVMVTWVPRDGEHEKRLADGVSLTLADGRVATTGNVFTWADATIADEQYVVRFAKDTPTDVTAIIGCAVMTGSGAVLNTADVQKGESVAVFGVGGVGLSAIVAAAERGANPIIAVDLHDEKLAFAKRFGATHGVNAAKEDPVEAIRALTRRDDLFGAGKVPVSGADYAFDCIGVKQTMGQILLAARSGSLGRAPGGTAVLVGVPQEKAELDAGNMLSNAKRYVGSIGGDCRPERDFPVFLRWYREGSLDLAALVTARYPLDAINDATTALAKGSIAGRAILEL